MTNSPFRIRAGIKGKREDGNSSVLLLLTLYSCFIVCSWLFPFAKKKKKKILRKELTLVIMDHEWNGFLPRT